MQDRHHPVLNLKLQIRAHLEYMLVELSFTYSRLFIVGKALCEPMTLASGHVSLQLFRKAP